MPLQSARFLTAAVLMALFVVATPIGRAAVTSELLVSDRHTGLALYGYDPVAYYIEHEAAAGSERFETSFAGLTWRFRSEANRAAFLASPGRYMPGFGGYDPIAVIRGVPVAGHPAVYAIFKDRLFLFAAAESREEFLQRPDALMQAAMTAWPAVRRTLVP